VSGFSDEQKKIALLLLSEPKTEEELHKQLNLPYDKLSIELKQMLKLGLVLKEGYPTKYRLRQDIIDELKKRKKISEEDSFKIKIRAIIELKAIEQTLLEKHVKKIIEAIKQEINFTIYSIESAEIVEEEEMYSTFIEVTLTVKDYSTLILFLFYYGPTSIEVIKPNKLELSQAEFQDGLVQLSGIFQKYADFMLKHLNKEELNKFYKNIYE
jgi:predicted transcriptional regulator